MNKLRSIKRPEGDRHFIVALARGLEILRVFRSNEESLGNTEIAKRCGLPKSSVSRFTHTLTIIGYLQLIPASGKYRLGLPSMSIGGTKFLNFYVKEYCKPLIHELANKTNSLIALGSPEGLDMLYLEAFRGNEIVTVSLNVGSKIPMATTSMGRAYLAACPSYEQGRLFHEIEAIYPDTWPIIKKGISQSFKDLKTLGCCCSFGDWNPNVNGIAVPINLGPGLLPMVLSSAGASHTLTKSIFMEKIKPELISTAKEIERKLGLLED